MTGVFRALDLEGTMTRPDREDAVHWVSVYNELIGACREFLAGVDDRPRTGSARACARSGRTART